MRQLLLESLLLALLGGAGGVLLAKWGVRLLVALSAAYLPRADEIQLNTPVFGFTLAVALVTGVLFGLLPAWQAARLDVTESLKEGGRSAGGAQRNRTLNLLVVGETALAVVLLIGAGLFLNSFVRLQQVRPGFDVRHLLTARIDLPDPYSQPEQKTQFFERLQQSMAALPGVEAVGLVTELPLAGQSADFRFKIERRGTQGSEQTGHADIRGVNHDYFRAMRIPLLKGRHFTEAETHVNARLAIISDVLARRFFAGQDPLGQHIRLDLPDETPLEIVGVVGDIRHRGLAGDLRQTIYSPSVRLGYANLVIRTTTDPLSLAATVRKTVAAIDPNQPVANIKTMEQWVSESVAAPRFRSLLLGVFSAVALLLAIVGIYGVMAYSVTQRTREIGLRMALGAQKWNALTLVIGLGMKLALTGVGIGVALSLALTRLLRNLLFEIAPTDPLTFSCVALFLVGVALLACWLPAHRAAKVDPMEALRYE